jgi:hypothetical protein
MNEIKNYKFFWKEYTKVKKNKLYIFIAVFKNK